MWKENFHRGLGRYGLGSVRVPPLILPQITGVLLDGRPNEGAWPQFPIVPRRNPWLVWLAEVMLSVQPSGRTPSGFYGQGAGGMPWARWDAKRCGPPLFFSSLFFSIMTCSCTLSTRSFCSLVVGTKLTVLGLTSHFRC